MPKRRVSYRSAFTLIEVMVAVMIVSVVIAALLQMQGSTTHKFMSIKEMMKTNQYNSFLLAHDGKYGFENSRMDMSQLVEDFDIESDLRRKLKSIEVELDYEELSIIDTNEFMDTPEDESQEEFEDQEQTDSTGIIFEIGKTILTSKEFSGSLIRVRVQ